MPNWCFSSYVLEGSEQEIKELDKTLVKLVSRKRPAVKSDFGKNWLGCLVNALGGDWKEIYCRGTWDDKNRTGNILRLTTETAWGPMNEVFDFICQKFPSIKYYFASEEEGMGEYLTNDVEGKYFPDRYHIDLCDPEENYDDEYFTSLEAMLDYINENYHPATPLKRIEDIEDLDDEWRMKNDDAFLNYHIIRVCE